MQRVQGPQTPYESYCFQCRVTFPVEARRCVHCGGRLARAGQGPPDAPPPQALAAGATGAADDEFDEEEGPFSLRRFGGLAIWAVVALSALLSNLCQGG